MIPKVAQTWLVSLTSFALLLPLQADDVPPPIQKPGSNSTIAVEGGEVRDDELWDFICSKMNEHSASVKDVKLMVNACYGGGLLDDMQRVFGPGGACEGIPWVGGSASAEDAVAWGWSDEVVNQYPEQAPGSMWTDALAGISGDNINQPKGIIREGSPTNNVLQDLQATANNDFYGPMGRGRETPQFGSGNNGDKIQWNMEGAKHEAIVFGGWQTNPRHSNNVKNVETSLKNVWKDAPHNINTIDGGTKEELFEALEDAIKRLDANTQLVLYIDDHGGSQIDLSEAAMAIADVLLEDPESFNFRTPSGWLPGLFGTYFGSNAQMPAPRMDVDVESCDGCSNWGFMLNGQEMPFPEGGDQTGRISLPLPFYSLNQGINLVEIVPRGSSSTQSAGAGKQTHFGSMRIGGLTLVSGPINDLENSALLPGQSAAFYNPDRNGEGLFVELLDGGLAVVYMFTYDRQGDGQAWMVGVGVQTGEGIIVEEMFKPVGAMFGEAFDPDDVEREFFGALAFHLPECGSTDPVGSLFIYPDGPTNYQNLVTHEYAQLTSLFDCETSVGDENGAFSGSWYDLSHDGEGIILEVLSNGLVLLQWFTYDSEGNQMWIQGTGTFDGKVLTVDNLYTAEGTRWGSQFNPDDITLPDWGSLTMEFTDCGAATVTYTSTAGFGAGTLNMVRLTNLMGITCTD